MGSAKRWCLRREGRGKMQRTHQRAHTHTHPHPHPHPHPQASWLKQRLAPVACPPFRGLEQVREPRFS
eukprot:5471887-Alexandrium_andersonii.AAC.1